MLRRLVAWVRANLVWLAGHPASLAIVGSALLGGGIAGVPVAERSYQYMWADPSFCDDCHVHDYANRNWAESVHADLTTCHDCHRVPIRHYPNNLFVATFDRPETPEDIPNPEVPTVICEQCHSSHGDDEPLTGPMPDAIRALVVRVDESPLHRVHLDAERRTPSRYEGAAGDQGPGAIGCMDCHGGENATVHQFPATSTQCETCHEGIRPADEAGRALSCLDCHARGFVGAQERPDPP